MTLGRRWRRCARWSGAKAAACAPRRAAAARARRGRGARARARLRHLRERPPPAQHRLRATGRRAGPRARGRRSTRWARASRASRAATRRRRRAAAQLRPLRRVPPRPRRDLPRAARLLGVHVHGGFAEYVVVPAERAFPVPADLDPRVAALAEPTAVVVRGAAPRRPRRRAARARARRRHPRPARRSSPRARSAPARSGSARATPRQAAARAGARRDARAHRGRGRAAGSSRAARRKRPSTSCVETVGGARRHAERRRRRRAPRRHASPWSACSSPRCALDTLPLLLKEVTLAWSYCYGRSDEPVRLRRRHRACSPPSASAPPASPRHAVPLADASRAFELAADRKAGAIKVSVIP